MLIIQHPPKDTALSKVEERLQELSLAYKLEVLEQPVELQLLDGSQTIVGFTAIQEYLDQLQGELGSWYYCSC